MLNNKIFSWWFVIYLGCLQVRRHRTLSVPQTDPAAEAAERRESAEHVSREQDHQHSQAGSRSAVMFLLWASRPYFCCVTVVHLSPVHSSHSARGFPARVHSLRSRRPRGKVAERAALPRLPQHSQTHLWLPAPTDLWPVSCLVVDYKML